jgi:hypothetical protein
MPRYISVRYDPFRKLYYRVFINKRNFGLNQTLQKSDEFFWSVIILDNSFKVLGEMGFNLEYYPNLFIPTPLGIMLLKHNNSSEKNCIITIIKPEL